MKVKLNDVIDASNSANEETQYFYSVKTEEILMVWNGMVNGEGAPNLIEEIEGSLDVYSILPGQYEIDEYSMMEAFIDSLPEGRKQDKLYDAISGRGAFRRFKDTI